MQFAQLSILVFGCITAASAAPQTLISLSSASVQEDGNHVDGNPDSSLAVTQSQTGQQPTLQVTQKLQSTHGMKEGEFLKVVDAIMKAVNLHANGNSQQSSGTEVSQGTDVIEITTQLNGDGTNSANEHAKDTDANTAFRKTPQFDGSQVKHTPTRTPLESDFDQIIQGMNTIKKENEKVIESPDINVKQSEVTKETNEISSKPFQEVQEGEIPLTKGGDLEIVTEITPPRKDASVNNKIQRGIGKETAAEVQQSELPMKETVTEIPQVEDPFRVTRISEDNSMNIAQTTEINTEKTKEKEPVESSTLPENKENILVKHTPLEDSIVSGNEKKSSPVPSEKEISADVPTGADSTFKNQDIELTTEIFNDPISDIVQSVSQVFDGALSVPQSSGPITKKLEAEEPHANTEEAKHTDIFTTTLKTPEAEVEDVQTKDTFTIPVKHNENPLHAISSPTTTTKVEDSTHTQTTSQAEISTGNPQVIVKANEPTEFFTTPGKSIKKPLFQAETTPKVIEFTSFPFKESTSATTDIKLGKSADKPFSSTSTGKSFTSNFIEGPNQVDSRHISNHFGFDSPSLMNTLSHKSFMFRGVPTDPKTLVPQQYRDFIYYNDAPEVTAAKIAFFRFQASLSPIQL